MAYYLSDFEHPTDGLVLYLWITGNSKMGVMMNVEQDHATRYPRRGVLRNTHAAHTHDILVSHSCITYFASCWRAVHRDRHKASHPRTGQNTHPSGWGHRNRHVELPTVGDSPQTVFVHLDCEVSKRSLSRRRRRRGGLLGFGRSSGSRTADEFRFSRSELKKIGNASP